jgi:uncharacterized protein (DUF433 family)
MDSGSRRCAPREYDTAGLRYSTKNPSHFAVFFAGHHVHPTDRRAALLHSAKTCQAIRSWCAICPCKADPKPLTYSDIITIEPGKRGGKPCIRGLRITVYDVLDYLASGMTHADILPEFPFLTEQDIRACLAYAADRERKLEISNA